MSEKGGRRKTIKNNKKVSKDEKTITLKLNTGVEIPEKNIYKEDSKPFNINDIGSDKIRVSNKKLSDKEYGSYKHYAFYEDGNEYIPLKITLLDVHGYYIIFKGGGKTMNFKVDDNSLEKIIDIFDYIGKILNIDLDNYMYEDKKGDTYFKTKVSDEICFRKDKDKTVIKFQMKRLSITVEYYYKYNLFTTLIMKMKIIILKYFYKVVDISLLLIID